MFKFFRNIRNRIPLEFKRFGRILSAVLVSALIFYLFFLPSGAEFGQYWWVALLTGLGGIYAARLVALWINNFLKT